MKFVPLRRVVRSLSGCDLRSTAHSYVSSNTTDENAKMCNAPVNSLFVRYISRTAVRRPTSVGMHPACTHTKYFFNTMILTSLSVPQSGRNEIKLNCVRRLQRTMQAFLIQHQRFDAAVAADERGCRFLRTPSSSNWRVNWLSPYRIISFYSERSNHCCKSVPHCHSTTAIAESTLYAPSKVCPQRASTKRGLTPLVVTV